MSTPSTLLVRCGTVYLSPLRLGRYNNAITQSCPRGPIQHNPLKGKVFPYSLPSVGPGADPGVQAVSPQVT